MMTHEDVVDLLTTAAFYDRRKVGQADVIAWHPTVHDLNLDEAKAAVVEHYTNSADWLMPAHVRTRVKRARELRIAQRPIPAPDPELCNNAPAYKAALDRSVERVGDKLDIDRKALPAPGHGATPSAEYNHLRGIDRDPLRVAAAQVRCPWPACKADIGSSCVDGNRRRLRQPAHEARLVAAGLAEWRTVNGVRRAVILAEQGGEDTP